MTIAITDVVLRRSPPVFLFATRLRLDDMLPIAAALDEVELRVAGCWGGATFDPPVFVFSARTRGFACAS